MFFKSKPKNVNYEIIQRSKLFDAEWYLHHNPDVSAAGIDPVRHYLRHGWQEGRDPSAEFSTRKYFELNPDVLSAKMNPLVHYEKYGRAKGREIKRLWDLDSASGTSDDLDFLLVTCATEKDGVYFYRIKFLAEALQHLGYRVAEETLSAPRQNIVSEIKGARVIIFNRPGDNLNTRELFKTAATFAKKVYIDLDDLLLPECACYFGRFKSGYVPYDRAFQIIQSQTRMFFNGTGLIVSTPLLAEYFKLGFPNSIHLPNVISASVVASSAKQKSDQTFRLIYASGTVTHDFDASLIICDLINFMLRHPDVEITVLGQSALGSSLSFLGSRLKVLPYCGFNEMIAEYGRHDLLLVPLEDNPFNNCKSNIKFIEAGAVGTPVLAAACREFEAVIKDGVNGFLYRSGQFGSKLEEVYMARHRLLKIGEKARRCVVKSHTAASHLPLLKQFLEQINAD